MLCSRVPFRVSFFGGGTDYPQWFARKTGKVVGCSLSHFCNITFRRLPPFFDFKTRVVWSVQERVDDHSNLKHPCVREVLRRYNIDFGVEIHHLGDLPAQSGLGSSSAFTIAMLNLAKNLTNVRNGGLHELASEAVVVERSVLKEAGGVQDQFLCALGGVNHLTISETGAVSRRSIHPPDMKSFESSFCLVYTGLSRNSSNIAEDQMKSISEGERDHVLKEFCEYADQAGALIENWNDGSNIDRFALMLSESWALKQSITQGITNPSVEKIISMVIAAGARGCKLMGAGGGGFVLAMIDPGTFHTFRNRLSSLVVVPFRIDLRGARIFDVTGS